MEKRSRIVALLILGLATSAVLACGLSGNPLSGAQGFAATAEAIASSIPSALPSGVPNIPDLTKYMNPTGTPVKEWNGIPIMSQAIAGEQFDKNTYSFRASKIQALDIQNFYNTKMAAAGWSPGFSTFVGSAGGILTYSKGASTVVVTVGQDGSDYVVLLVKQ